MPANKVLPKFAFDSTSFIDWVKEDKKYFRELLAIINKAKDRELDIVASVNTIYETLKCFEDGSMTEEEQLKKTSNILFGNVFVIPVPFDVECAMVARNLRIQDKTIKTLGTSDLLCLATAIRYGCDFLITRDGSGKDKGLIHFSGATVKPYPPQKIITPRDWADQYAGMFKGIGDLPKVATEKEESDTKSGLDF